MPVLRSIKSDYEFFHHQKLDIMVALDSENRSLLSNFWKSNKGKRGSALPNVKVTGYKLVFDPEFESLKIDFSESFPFEAKELEHAKLQ